MYNHTDAHHHQAHRVVVPLQCRDAACCVVAAGASSPAASTLGAGSRRDDSSLLDRRASHAAASSSSTPSSSTPGTSAAAAAPEPVEDEDEGEEGQLLFSPYSSTSGPVPGNSHHLRPGIVHRLDKGTSGLLVVAKTEVRGSRFLWRRPMILAVNPRDLVHA